MSRIGKLPIKIPGEVEVKIAGGEVSVKGPKGSLSRTLPAGITAKLEESALILARRDDSKQQRSLHGLARALLANAVRGVTEGFGKTLEVHGVGFRAQVEGKTVVFNVGYTHPIRFPIPEDVQVKVERQTIRVTGIDRQRVGQVAADMRALRPPEVYKQKGIRYEGERVRTKAGKAGAK